MTVITTSACYNQIADSLREVMKMYRKAIEMNLEDQERLILTYFSGISEKHEMLAPMKEACDIVLNKWTEGLPHDSTLIEETRKLLSPPFKALLPVDEFDRNMHVYRWMDMVIQGIYDELFKLDLDKRDWHIIKELHRRVRNTLVDNPNFKGDHPYYKRRENVLDYGRAKKLWLELLDDDFINYISYFKE